MTENQNPPTKIKKVSATRAKEKNQIQENKDKIISIRFKPSELEKLDRNCKEVGLTRSAYINRKILSLPVQPARVPELNWEAYEILTAIAYHLPRIGNNLNQIAKILNTARLEETAIATEIPDVEKIKNTVATIAEIQPQIDRIGAAILGVKQPE